jgi:hypothetical protein
MKSIDLAGKAVAIVDDEDYDYLVEHYCWWHHKDKSHPLGYAQGQERGTGKHVYMHRVIARRMGWEIGGMLVDHRDFDTLRNVRSNFRLATHSQSQHHKRIPRNNTSGHKGVSWCSHTKKWTVQVHRFGKAFARFQVSDFQLACDASDMLRIVAHGAFASQN